MDSAITSQVILSAVHPPATRAAQAGRHVGFVPSIVHAILKEINPLLPTTQQYPAAAATATPTLLLFILILSSNMATPSHAQAVKSLNKSPGRRRFVVGFSLPKPIQHSLFPLN